MGNYYSEKLSAERLKRCYDIASKRIKQYLDAEVNYVLEKIKPGSLVLELGCGYGRIFPLLTQKAGFVVGIDTAKEGLAYGMKFLKGILNFLFIPMDAANLSFPDQTFDTVICIQNGISAFHTDRKKLINESFRVTKPGGTILFSGYSDKIWTSRLEWFWLQANEGLVGEIDNEKTGNGVIVCKDGFTAYTVTKEQFHDLTTGLNADVKVTEVDESSLFCEMTIRIN